MRQECCLFYPSPREQGSPGGTAHGLAVVLLQGDARAGQLVKVGRDDLLQVRGAASPARCQQHLVMLYFIFRTLY